MGSPPPPPTLCMTTFYRKSQSQSECRPGPPLLTTHPICLSGWRYSLPSLSTVWDSVSVVSSVVPSVLLGLVPLRLKPPRPPAPDILSLLWDLLWPRARLEAGVPRSTLCRAGDG